MGRAPCCDKTKVKKGPWSPEEDAKLKSHIQLHGTGGNWIALPTKIGLKRCGKSCRLRWLNYLRPNINHGAFTQDEDNLICSLYLSIGTRWSVIAGQLPGRTDNDIKNYWNTKLKKKLFFANQRTTTSSSSSSPLSDHPLPLSTNTIMPPPLPHLQQPTAFCYYNSNTHNYMEAAAAGFHCAQLWENSGVDLVSSQHPITTTTTTTSSSSSMESLSWEEIIYYTNYPLFHHDPTSLPYSQ